MSGANVSTMRFPPSKSAASQKHSVLLRDVAFTPSGIGSSGGLVGRVHLIQTVEYAKTVLKPTNQRKDLCVREYAKEPDMCQDGCTA